MLKVKFVEFFYQFRNFTRYSQTKESLFLGMIELFFFCDFSCSAISTHVGAMILGRFIVGLELGLSGPVTAMYVSEVMPVLRLFGNGIYSNRLDSCSF